MDIKTFSVALTKEERAALYEVSTRECRRPPDQIRFLLRQALGITGNQEIETTDNAQNGAGNVFPDTNAILS